MKLKSNILLLLGIFIFCCTYAQSDVNYKHKTITKALSKAGVTDMDSIEELVMPDSVFSSNQINGKYFLIKEENENHFEYIYVGRVNSCRAGGCSVSRDISSTGSSEYFDYFILFDHKKTVQTVKVFNYQATHGHEITAKGWLKQFIGHNGSEQLQVDKNIDAISGATISVYAITADVEMKTEILKRF